MPDSDSNYFPVQSKRAAAVYVYLKKNHTTDIIRSK